METPLSPLDLMRRTRRLYPHHEAVIDGELRLSYEQFFARCDRWSSALSHQLGVKQGDRVAYIAPNTHAQLESFYAVPQIGAVLVPINYRLTADDFVYITSHSGAKVLCVHPDYVAAVDGVRDQLTTVQHFVVLGPGVDLLINFSLGGRPGLARDDDRAGRVIVLARGRQWTGFVEATPDLDMSRDGCRGRFGDHRVEIRGRGYRVVVDAPAHGVYVDATFRPATVPITARRQAIAPGRHLDWSLTARLAVDAHIELAGETFDLVDAVGYHDHNWGHFAWGDDFTWEWGSVLPSDGGERGLNEWSAPKNPR